MAILHITRHLCDQWAPRLTNCFHQKSFSERVRLYWRDIPMIAGTVTSTIGVAVAFFQGSAFLGLTLTFGGMVILFGSQYVSRYAELVEMEAQLKQLQKSNQELNQALQAIKLENARHTLVGDKLSKALTKYKKLEPKITDATIRLHTAQDELSEIQASIKSETAELTKIREALQTEAAHLSKITEDLRNEVDRLSQSNLVQNSLNPT